MKEKYESRFLSGNNFGETSGAGHFEQIQLKTSYFTLLQNTYFSKYLYNTYYSYYTKKNVITYEVEVSQTKCFDLKYQLDKICSFQISGKNPSFCSIET